VARAIVRSVRKPTPEVNMVRMFRFAYGIHGFFPFLRDFDAGRQFSSAELPELAAAARREQRARSR
jgi:hypothetical protein